MNINTPMRRNCLRVLAFLVGAAALSACTVDPVKQMGPNEYFIRAQVDPLIGCFPVARNAVMSEAKKHCENMGKEVLVSDIVESWQLVFMGECDVKMTFQCVDKGNQALESPPR